ncbi:MAG: type IV pilus assembly protein PilM [Phycisphaerae bacterium]|nr:type IV pilus assembly protein PilM [Phycisphaerae bacterium]
MASEYGSVWAIDIGNSSLKALRLRLAGNAVEVIGFDNIQHGKVLTGSGIKAAERDELIALSLRQFVKQNDLGKDDVIVSVPSQNSFARFVKLPPVEQKRIPEIVKFEAAQQIPFDINDVQWDWQLMTEADGSETKVGIFAVKSEVVNSVLEHFARENVKVSYVQMSPMALYNYLLYDHADLGKSENQATVILDIGAENSDLVVCTPSTVWQRCVPMGGNAFTRAIAETFKLNFEKAEKLKRTAPMSKYARQVFQAMKPIFTDLASEIQRSLGFYTSSNPNTKIVKIIALGGGAKMRGLLQYLRQTLQMPVEIPDSFKKLTISPDVSAAKFHESVCDFGIVYGLALQGLGQARIESNLLPRSVARSMVWAAKTKYFIAAASAILLVSLMCFGRTFLDKMNYANNNQVRQKINNIVNAAKQADEKLKDEQSKGMQSEAIIEKELKLFDYRDVVPLLHQTIISVLPNEKNNAEQKELYGAFANDDIETVLKTPRKERKQIFVTGMSAYFTSDIASAQFKATDFTQRSNKAEAVDYRSLAGRSDASIRDRRSEVSPQSSRMTRSQRTIPSAGSQEEAESLPGFVVTLTGYSPYKNINELMDPPGVEGEPNKWGVVTRLLHLDDVVDWKNQFELYKKAEIEHFKLETGEVSLEAAMPAGIGVSNTDAEENDELALIDPMTRETISKVAELNEDGKRKLDKSGKAVYEVNDHWFKLDVKFVWKGALNNTEETESIKETNEVKEPDETMAPERDERSQERRETESDDF